METGQGRQDRAGPRTRVDERENGLNKARKEVTLSKDEGNDERGGERTRGETGPSATSKYMATDISPTSERTRRSGEERASLQQRTIAYTSVWGSAVVHIEVDRVRS
jgi:hypothetical protein